MRSGVRGGINSLSVSDFCDLVWTEVWDDCPAMGDQHQYRDIMEKLFLQGMDPWNITYETTDKNGKKVTRTLGSAPAKGIGRTPPKTQVQQMNEWAERAKMLREAKNELASPPDG